MYFGEGSIDFYTPKEYGGGKKAEGLLKKAVETDDKNEKSEQLSTWGKEEAYDLLIRFYLRENQKDKAKVYFDKAKQLFPDSYIIQMHQSDFKSLFTFEQVKKDSTDKGKIKEGFIVRKNPISEKFSVKKLNKLDIYLNPAVSSDLLKNMPSLSVSTTQKKLLTQT